MRAVLQEALEPAPLFSSASTFSGWYLWARTALLPALYSDCGGDGKACWHNNATRYLHVVGNVTIRNFRYR
jgi:hypothetical protein